MSDSIEAAAKVIDPLAFEPVGACPPRGYESHTAEALSRVIAARRVHALRVAERVVAAYHDAELAALRAQLERKEAECVMLEQQRNDAWDHSKDYDATVDLLADCQSVVRERGHAEGCPAVTCAVCAAHGERTWHKPVDDPDDFCQFTPVGPCSDACGHDRVMGGAV